MPLPLRHTILSCIIALSWLFAYDAQALSLVHAGKSSLKTTHDSTDTPIIIYFDSKLDVRALRREIRTSIQGKNLSRKDLRRLHKKQTRQVMLKRLKANLAKPYTTLETFLAEQGIKRNINKLWSINALALSLPSELINQIHLLEGVERVGIDYTFSMSETTSAVTSGIPLWNLEDINATTLWEDDLTGEGVVVGILDSGVDLNHPDLIEKWRGGNNSWYDPHGVYPSPVDFVGHGTQVAGLVVGGDTSGYQIGVAPRAKWIAARVFDDAGDSSISTIVDALQWMMNPDGDDATDDAADIINNSWVIVDKNETTINKCLQSIIELDPNTPDAESFAELSDILLEFREMGIGVVFSGGNFGPQPETSLPPANEPSIDLSVGSINQNHEVEFTSSRGPGACDGTIYPKLVAPGDGIFTTDKLPNSYTVVSGTSFAAPHVTGAIAQLMSAPFEASLSQIESALRETALDIDQFGPDNNSGYGLIDVAAAYEWLLSSLEITEAGILLFSSPSYSVDENTGRILVNVRRIGGSKGEVSVDYRTLDGTALGFANHDYLSTSGTLTFNDSETIRSIEITINDDQLDEINEEFSIELSNPTGDALLGNTTVAPIIILDDDGPGELSMESSSYAVNEHSAAFDILVLRSGGYEGEVSVDFSTIDDTAHGITDYKSIDGRLSFADGERSNTITIEIINDEEYEDNETFNLILTDPLGGAEISDIASSTITILNDDVDPLKTVIQMSSASYDSLENSGVVEVELLRLGDTSDSVTVDYTTTDGSAKAGEDYEKTNGTVTFAPGVNKQTVAVGISIHDDNEPEGNESFNIALYNASNDAQLGNPTTSIITINDNDALPFVSLSSIGGSLRNTGDTLSDSTKSDTETGPTDSRSEYSDQGSLLIHHLSLSGFSGLGTIDNDDLNQASENLFESSIIDMDNDGYIQSIDCDDFNPRIHPGAAETKHDGIDQDCNGYDLTIDITSLGNYSATGLAGSIQATTQLKNRGNLSIDVRTIDGTRINEDMRWNKSTNSWHSNIYDLLRLMDTKPSHITVTGTEGSESESYR